MAAPKTRPGNPDRGWNDPPMFNYNAATDGAPPPRRALNKRVAFPMTASGNVPGHAVLSPSQGPPLLNPMLPGDTSGPIHCPIQPPIPIALQDTPIGNQVTPASPKFLLPPSADTSMPQTVPLLVPGLIPASTSPPEDEHVVPDTMQLQDERLDELMSRLSLSDDTQLLQHTVDNLVEVLNEYKGILTTRVIDDIKKKIELFEEKWKSGTLSETVKVRITQLASALQNGLTDKANHLHLALMVDHIAEVNQWMMGVKRLLQQQQLANKQKEIIAENKLNNSQSCDTANSESSDPVVCDEGERTVNDSTDNPTESSRQKSDDVIPDSKDTTNCDNTEQVNDNEGTENS